MISMPQTHHLFTSDASSVSLGWISETPHLSKWNGWA